MHTGVCCRRVLQDFHVTVFLFRYRICSFFLRCPVVNPLVMSMIFDKETISNQLTFKVYYLLKQLTVLKSLLYR